MQLINYQGNAVVNYTNVKFLIQELLSINILNLENQPVTVISREYSSEWHKGDEPYYPINNERNNELYQRYRELADKEKRVIFGGRLGGYKYYDMDKVIKAALEMCSEELV